MSSSISGNLSPHGTNGRSCFGLSNSTSVPTPPAFHALLLVLLCCRYTGRKEDRTLEGHTEFDLHARQRREFDPETKLIGKLVSGNSHITFFHTANNCDRIGALYLANTLFLSSSTSSRLLRYALATYATVMGIMSPYLIDAESKLVAAAIRAFGAYCTMKTLDLHFSRGYKFYPNYDPSAARANSALRMPTFDTERQTWVGLWSYAARVTASMRYEDFDISVIKRDKFTNHPMRQAMLSCSVLAGIAATCGIPPYMTVDSSVISAFFFLLALHATFCGFHFIPGFGVPLFEKHFLEATSLSEFWTRHWHGLFTSPIKNLAFMPVKRLTHSNALALCAAMAFSGLFHWFVVEAFDDKQASFRVFWFFALQGPACIVDSLIWVRQKSTVLRKAFAWFVMLGLASWVVRGFPSVAVTNADITWLVKHIGEGRF